MDVDSRCYHCDLHHSASRLRIAVPCRFRMETCCAVSRYASDSNARRAAAGNVRNSRQEQTCQKFHVAAGASRRYVSGDGGYMPRRRRCAWGRARLPRSRRGRAALLPDPGTNVLHPPNRHPLRKLDGGGKRLRRDTAPQRGMRERKNAQQTGFADKSHLRQAGRAWLSDASGWAGRQWPCSG